jgi:hypothetical protein
MFPFSIRPVALCLEGPLALLVILYRELAFGEAAIEDCDGVIARSAMSATERIAQQPDDAHYDIPHASAKGRSGRLAKSI